MLVIAGANTSLQGRGPSRVRRRSGGLWATLVGWWVGGLLVGPLFRLDFICDWLYVVGTFFAMGYDI